MEGIDTQDMFDELDVDLEPVITSQANRKFSRLRKGGALHPAAPIRSDPPVAGGTVPAVHSRCSSPAAASASEAAWHSPEQLANPKATSTSSPVGSTQDLASNASGSRQSYWDEEDELEEDVKRAMQKQAQPSKSDSSTTSRSSEESDQQGSDASGGSDEHEPGTSQLLQGSPQSGQGDGIHERIGQGQAAAVQPLSGVLHKLLQRRQVAITRASRQVGRAPGPPAPQPPAPAAPQPIRMASDELVLLSDDDDPAQLSHQRMDNDTLAQADRFAGQSTMPPLLQHPGPMADTQDLCMDSEPVREVGLAPALAAPALRLVLDSETQGAFSQDLPGAPGPMELVDPACYGAPSAAGQDQQCDEGEARQTRAAPLVGQPESSWPVGRLAQMDCDSQDRPGRAGRDSSLLEEGSRGDDKQEEERDEEEDEEALLARKLTRSAPESSLESQQDQQGSEEAEEAEASDSGDESSSSESSPEMDEEARRAAMKEALREARRALRDRPRKRSKQGLFEEEAELSEEEGQEHRDSDEDDDDNGQDHRALLAELIGHEKDGKRDEAKRAALHARWQEAQDEEAVQRLLRGIQHGFRSRRGPRGGGALYAEEGTNYDARLRRAALAARQSGEAGTDDSEDADSAADGSDDDESRSSTGLGPTQIDLDALEAMSDDEAKAELKQYHHQQLLEAAHKEAAKELQLLDNDAMRVLSMFAKSAQQPPPAPTNQSNDQKRRSAGFAADVTNRARPAKQGSFIGLGSSASAAGVSRSTWQHANAKSYVFGQTNDSNSIAAPDAQEEHRAPTSFAGLHHMINTVPSNAHMGSAQGLLDVLGARSPGRAVLRQGDHGDQGQHLPAVLAQFQRANASHKR